MQEGYRRDTSYEGVQDHIGKCKNYKSQEYSFAVHHLVATGKYNDVIACKT